MKSPKSKKSTKKQARRAKSSPLPFLTLCAAFCLVLTYLWNVWYIPYLPKSEVPPFLAGESSVTDEKPVTADTVVTENPLFPDTSDSTLPASVSVADDNSAVTSAKETAAPPDTEKQPAAPTPQTTQVTTAPPSADTQSSSTVYKRRTGVCNILIAGKDDAASNTDVLLLVSVDTENGSAAAVQIPRDTYLDGYKINALWARYTASARRAGSSSPESDGMETLCDTLEQTLCIRIDHWALCSLSAFRTLVDTGGGVTVDVPCDMEYEDAAQNLSIQLSAGVQTLDGNAAEQLVRFRSGYVRGDLGRVEMQKLCLAALLRQMKTGISVLDLPALVQTAVKYVKTSLSFSDILFYAKAAQSLDMDKVTFLTLPGMDCREYGNSGAWYYVLSRQGTWEAVNRYLNVYEVAVDGKLFDRTYRLTDTEKSALLSYYKTYLTADGVTGAEIEKNGVNVALN